MSIRATEGGPPWGPTGPPEPEEKRRNIKLIALALLVAIVATVGVLAATGVIHVPFIGSNTVTEGDPLFGWTLAVPTKWTSSSHSLNQSDVRFLSEGSGVGVQVRAQRYYQEIPADQVSKDLIVQQVKPVINDESAQLTIVEGPTFGKINGVPYVKFLYTYFVPINGVRTHLEHSQYHFFNGANVEEVTYETQASKYSAAVSDITKSIQTFHSTHLSPAPTPAASASPSASPSH
ncbi:MAG TPA: hypothetical protein VET24_09675 [Actinomycetota bacterium]|nr:hypothetical protein [Actinomycetota bacterium]